MTPVTSAPDAESLFAQYSDRLVRYLSGVAGERETARDLTQEVFLRVSRTAIPIAPEDQLAWTVQTTPTRLAGEAATFRVQWMRNRDNGKPSTIGDDAELTLRPGQALTLDLMPQSDDASGACVSLSLSVGVVYWPEPDQDRRLLGVNLWLVERLPDGKERSQPLSLRGLYNQPIPFHFDTISAGTKTLDVFGDLQISPGTETTGIKITTRSRVIDLEPLPRPAGYAAAAPWPPPYTGSTTATLQVGPGEVVSVPLAPVGRGGADAEAFAARALSFRIRVRQIR